MNAEDGPHPTPAAPPAQSSPDDHRKFSLGEDWAATIIGLILFAFCLGGIITPDMVP